MRVFTHISKGRSLMVLSACRGHSAAKPSAGVGRLFRHLLSLALPALSLVACQNTKESLPPLQDSFRLRLTTPSSSYPRAEVRHADIFIYDAETGILDSWQRWDGNDDEILTCSSAKRERVAVAIANLPQRTYRLDEIRSLEDLETLRCSLADEQPGAPVMSGQLRVGDGYDETATLPLRPLLSRIRLRSLRTDFSERPYAGAALENVRLFLVNAGSETRLFPNPDTDFPSGYANLSENCDAAALPYPELLSLPLAHALADGEMLQPEADLFCYPNPSTDEGPGTPMTRLVIQAELMGETWYYPLTVPQPRRNCSYDFDVTLTSTGSRDPDVPVDASSAQVTLDVTDWEEKVPEIIPFRRSVRVSLEPLSRDPGEDRHISDLNLFVFSADGTLQERHWWSSREWSEEKEIRIHLLAPLEYSFVACANIGYELADIRSMEDLAAYRYYLVYPDEYSHGIPMVGTAEVEAGTVEEVRIPLERLLAKVTLQMDRSCLDSDIRFNIRSVEIGNCPKSVRLLGESRIDSGRDIFAKGFCKEGTDMDPLNLLSGSGKSGTLDLYLLENIQGELLDGPRDAREKILPDGSPKKNVCSYVELHIDYDSDDWLSDMDHYLIYRFYLGESPTDFSVRRNAHYSYVITPEGDGLNESPWRIDRSGLDIRKRFELHPAAYNECSSSESYHIWCDVSPATTPMTIEPLAYDDDVRVEDLYYYEIDPDGFGITIHPRKGGSALVYFSAGEPVWRDTLALLVIDP